MEPLPTSSGLFFIRGLFLSKLVFLSLIVFGFLVVEIVVEIVVEVFFKIVVEIIVEIIIVKIVVFVVGGLGETSRVFKFRQHDRVLDEWGVLLTTGPLGQGQCRIVDQRGPTVNIGPAAK
jgi:hypothetical protein